MTVSLSELLRLYSVKVTDSQLYIAFPRVFQLSSLVNKDGEFQR